RRLLAGAGRPPAPRDGQEEERGHGEGEGRVHRRCQEGGRRREDCRRGVRAHGGVRRLRVQQVALGGLWAGDLPDGVLEEALPRGVHGRGPHLRQGRHRQGGQERGRGALDGDRGAAAGRQRIGQRFLGGRRRGGEEAAQGDPLRVVGGEGGGGRRGRVG